MIWLPELIEPASNFEQFFTRADNKILNYRNVWLLDYRNQGDSDHNPSYAMEVSALSPFLTTILEGYVK